MLILAAGAVEELSKDNPSSEIVEYKTKDFVKTVEVSGWVGDLCTLSWRWLLSGDC